MTYATFLRFLIEFRNYSHYWENKEVRRFKLYLDQTFARTNHKNLFRLGTVLP